MNELPGSTACETAQAEMSAYLDGDLAAAEAACMEDHLQQCAGCRAEIDLLRLVTRSLRLAAQQEPPAAVRQRLFQQVAAELLPPCTELLCIELHGDQVVRRQEVRLRREPERALQPGWLPAVPASPTIQQYQREWSQRGNYSQTVHSQYGRNPNERRA